VQASAGQICSREASAAAAQTSEGRSSGSDASAAARASAAGLGQGGVSKKATGERGTELRRDAVAAAQAQASVGWSCEGGVSCDSGAQASSRQPVDLGKDWIARV
jgi:hypothetical protein